MAMAHRAKRRAALAVAAAGILAGAAWAGYPYPHWVPWIVQADYNGLPARAQRGVRARIAAVVCPGGTNSSVYAARVERLPFIVITNAAREAVMAWPYDAPHTYAKWAGWKAYGRFTRGELDGWTATHGGSVAAEGPRIFGPLPETVRAGVATGQLNLVLENIRTNLSLRGAARGPTSPAARVGP